MESFKILAKMQDMTMLISARELKVYRLGFLRTPRSKINADLREYFIDEDGDLYSLNKSTYVTKYGKVLEKLSDSSLNQTGEIVNTFRDLKGRKVTFSRRKLKNLLANGHFELVQCALL